jgi:hypothetical protein
MLGVTGFRRQEMRVTAVGSDYIRIDEQNIDDKKLLGIPRVHLIKLDFEKPTETKVKKVISLYPKTNRFVVDENVKTYNVILKDTNKKYYVENTVGSKIISFFKKNNKVLVNFNNLTEPERNFLLSEDCFDDVLKNAEVILLNKPVFDVKSKQLEVWSGNVIVHHGGPF